MKLLIGLAFSLFSIHFAHGQINLGPLQSGPGANGPTTSQFIRHPGYPQIFNTILSEDAKQRLRDIATNRDLNGQERRKQIDEILDKIPPSELSKLPLPSGFEKLPSGVYDQLKQIHEDQTMKWTERKQKVRQLLRTVPHDQRRAVFRDMWFPPMPPAGFEAVLSPTVFKQLMAVHENPKMSVPEKKQHVDRIMQQVPAEQLARLPLPPLMRKLPQETQQRIRSIMHNYQVPWEERHQKVREFVKSLPVEEKRSMRPPLPSFIRDLPADVQAKLQSIHDNDELEIRERMHQFRDVIDSLPEALRERVLQHQQNEGPWRH